MPETDVDALVALNDSRLEPLLRGDASTRQQEIERLIVQVSGPLVDSILRRYVREGSNVSPHDAEDIAATISLRLVAKLRALRFAPEEAVADFEQYVAGLTYNAINDHLRVAFPARTRLKNRLRYVSLRDPRLALWSADGALCGGLAAWSGIAGAAATVPIEARNITGVMLDATRPAEALVALFRAVQRAVVFEALVDFFAGAWQVVDGAPVRGEQEDPRAETVQALEDRQQLRVLWNEVKKLRPMQRKALLLNLRSAEAVNAISLFVLVGIATFEDVAAALELAPQDLAQLWPNLPLDDLQIAELLGVKRQQVINLRKAARARLARRLGG